MYPNHYQISPNWLKSVFLQLIGLNRIRGTHTVDFMSVGSLWTWRTSSFFFFLSPFLLFNCDGNQISYAKECSHLSEVVVSFFPVSFNWSLCPYNSYKEKLALQASLALHLAFFSFFFFLQEYFISVIMGLIKQYIINQTTSDCLADAKIDHWIDLVFSSTRAI